MDDVSCVRGCVSRGNHFAMCPDFGRRDGACKGCVPREARSGTFLCDRCIGRVRRNLDDAPDLVANLRARIDPRRAQVFDKTMVSGSLVDMTPAPMRVELVDACNDIVRMLGEWELFVTGHAVPRATLPPGHSAPDAHSEVLHRVSAIVRHLPELFSNRVQIEALCQFVLDDWLEGTPDSNDAADMQQWTLARALHRWRLDNRVYRATTPCPSCDRKSVLVRHPKIAHTPTMYSCTECDFERDDTDRDQPWTLIFEHVVVDTTDVVV